jgi:uncharacterized membrane protein YtjA (UPF0391 family)
MVRWSVTFLIVALLAAIVGFGGIAASLAPAAKMVFYVFTCLFIFSLGVYKPTK